MTTSISQKPYTHLSGHERFLIANMWHRERSISHIAKALGRHKSTISRELKRNGGTRVYDEERAEVHARKRWKQTHRKYRLTFLQRVLVTYYIMQYYSPEQVSYLISREYPTQSISTESIYMYIYECASELREYLKSRRKTRKKRGNSKKSRRIGIKERVSIHERGDISQEYGHWEADLIGASSKSTILVLTERQLKYTRMIQVCDKTAKTIRDEIMRFLETLPAFLRKSITYDNGKENAYHYEINEKFHMKSYFCDPYSAWQKGLVENTIGKIRQFFPKKTNFNNISEYDIMKVQEIINNRPWKSIGFQIPNQLFAVALSPRIHRTRNAWRYLGR